MNHDDIDRVFGRGRLRMVTGDHVEVFREASLPGERRRYTKRFLATAAGDFRHWTEREWRILARLVGHAIGPVPDVVHYDRGLAGDKVAQVQTYDAGITVDHWATLLPVRRAGQSLDHVFQDCAHWWALARHSLIALDAIHAIGLVHLDLKADNICIPFEPAALDPLAPAPWIAPRIEQIALIDFAFSLVSGEQLTRALPIARQPDYDYQSPRLLDALDAGHRGDLGPTRELDWRCDLFSLAAMLRRYLPDPEAAPANGWTSALDARARALVRRLLQAHDGEATAQRPHAELFTFASAPLADARLAASLESGWWLARTPVDASALSPTPVTRVALPPQPPAAVAPPVEVVEQVVPEAVPVPERSGPAPLTIDLHAEPALRVNLPPARRRAPWGWAAAAVAVAALALPVLSGHWRGLNTPPPAADVPAALAPPVVTALAQEEVPARPAPVIAASAPVSLPDARLPVAASQAAAVVVAQAPEEAPEEVPDARAVAVPSVTQPPALAQAGPSAPAKPTASRKPARRAQRPAVAAARPPTAPATKATQPSPARAIASATPRRPTAAARPQVVARAGTVTAARSPTALLPTLPTAPVTLPPAPVTLPPPPVAVPPAASPAPAPATAARDHAARADELLAYDLPRIAQRAERLVLPVLAAVGNGPEGDVRAAARTLRVAPGDPRLEAQASPADARALHEAARQALWRRGSLQEAVELQSRAFGANPLDSEVTSRLASLWLRQHPRQPEVARQLALHALTLPDGRHPHGRPEDWTTLALANALSGREREARQAWWVSLELASDPDQPCRAAAQAYAQYGERVRPSVEALLRRARTMGLDEESAHCEWPSHWARWR
jgi:hypothetical protein